MVTALQPWEKQPDELEAEWVAFECFRDMQPRKISKVSRALALPLPTVKAWAKEYYWNQRTLAYDRFLTRGKVKLRVAHENATMRRQLRLIGKARDLAEKSIEVHLTTVNAMPIPPSVCAKLLDSVIKLERLVRGESTENVAVAGKIDLTRLTDSELAQLDALTHKATPTP